MLKIDFLLARDKCRGKEGNIRDINLIKTFIEKGYTCGMISSCQLVHAQLKQEGIFSIQMVETIRVPSGLEDMERRALRIEEEYNIPSLKRFIFPEKCYYREDEDYLFRKAIVYFEELEKLFNRLDVGCVVQGQGSQINVRAIYFIARKRGIPVIYFGESLFPNKILLFSDEMKTLDRFKIISWGEMNDRQKKEIESYIQQSRGKQGVFSYSLLFSQKAKVVRSFIGLQEYVKNKQFKALRDAFARKIGRGVSSVFDKIFSSFVCQPEIKDEKFIYFPLHTPDDAQITLRNLQFYDQTWLVLYIARNLPFGYKLYVKEHPETPISVQDKRKIAKEKNVTLICRNVNSHKIINKAEAIIIINSTVGFEALSYFKPVIVLGNWVLRGRGVTIDVADLSKLDEAIKTALKAKVDPAKIKSFLFSLRESMYEGEEVTLKMDYAKIVDMLVKKYKELKS